MRNHEWAAEAKVRLSSQVAAQPTALSQQQNVPISFPNPLAGLMSRSGSATSATTHADVLTRGTASRPARAQNSLLQLQRHYGNQYVQRMLAVARQVDDPTVVASEVEQTIQQARGHGQTLDSSVRKPMESAFGADFSGVRVHTGTQANALNQALSARAFTTGQDIFFRQEEYNPRSASGQELLAHELTHVVQQSGSALQTKLVLGQPNDTYEQEANQVAQQVMHLSSTTAGTPITDSPTTHSPGVQRMCAECEEESKATTGGALVTNAPEGEALIGGANRWQPGHQLAVRQPDLAQRLRKSAFPPTVQCELAIEPPNPTAVATVLTEAQIQEAIRYNDFRFKDPFSIAVVRDVIGIPKYPAVSDRDLALAAAQWQAEFNLTVDGKVGPTMTRTLVRELRAEDQRALAQQLRQDNYVTWSTVNGPTRTACSAAGFGRFQWDVNFDTSLRGGWIIQRLDNTWNVTPCAVGGPVAGGTPTLQYWEAWWVDNNGRIWIPTSLATPPTTAAPATADDLWRRPAAPGTRGRWSMSARLYTTLTLPAGFAHGAVADAGALPATTAAPNSDDLGLVVASRRQGGEWDCCDPSPVNHFHRAA